MLKIIFVFLGIIARLCCPEEVEKPRFQPRIIHGVPVYPHEIPFIVSIQTKRDWHYCGGSLIDWHFVLTAAHCVTKRRGESFLYEVIDPSTIEIEAGDISVGQNAAIERTYRNPIGISVHENYSLHTTENDIALIRLNTKFVKHPQIDVVELSFSTPKEKQKCYVAGWGVTEKGAQFYLQKANVEIKNWHKCNRHHAYDGRLPQNTICAGAIGALHDAKGVEDSCQGDSGGPLVCNSFLTGVVSFGKGCGNERYPGIYTNVFKFRLWIDENMTWLNLRTLKGGGNRKHNNYSKFYIVLLVIMVIYF